MVWPFDTQKPRKQESRGTHRESRREARREDHHHYHGRERVRVVEKKVYVKEKRRGLSVGNVMVNAAGSGIKIGASGVRAGVSFAREHLEVKKDKHGKSRLKRSHVLFDNPYMKSTYPKGNSGAMEKVQLGFPNAAATEAMRNAGFMPPGMMPHGKRKGRSFL